MSQRTWATAQTLLGLESHAEWWRAHYHLFRPHESLRVALAQPIQRTGRQMPRRYRSRTPAMAAGITRHRWSVTGFLSFPLPEVLLQHAWQSKKEDRTHGKHRNSALV